MAELATIARPYARAAFAHAAESKAYAAWSTLLAAGAAVAADPKASQLLGNPRVRQSEVVALIDGVATGAGASVGDAGRNFLGVLAENRRLHALPEIAVQYEKLRADAENTLEADVTVAMPLTDAQRAELSRALGVRFQRVVRINEQVDATLLGGAIVRAGDVVIDGSLRGRLGLLEQQISQP
jgi:F-type H+-transporting ATPase subunit delta